MPPEDTLPIEQLSDKLMRRYDVDTLSVVNRSWESLLMIFMVASRALLTHIARKHS